MLGLLVLTCLTPAPGFLVPGRGPALLAVGVAAQVAGAPAVHRCRRTGTAPLWWGWWATAAVRGAGACVGDAEVRQCAAVALVVAPLFTAVFAPVRSTATRWTALHLALTVPGAAHLAGSTRGSAFERGFRAACALAVVTTVVVCVAVLRRRLDDALARADRLALHDPLTGLLNRRGLAERAAALPASPWLGVLVADVDRFKSVNDRFGRDRVDLAPALA